jgi:hypothetical protein
MTLEISGYIFEQYSNVKFHDSHQAGAELFRADRQLD